MSVPEFTTGFELEYSKPSHLNALEVLGDTFGDIKTDGTVPQGFELASKIYLSHNFCNDTFCSDFDVLFSNLDRLNVSTESREGAGHHIHIQRNIFTPEQIYKLNKFVCGYGDFTRKIGERDFTFYCRNELNPVHYTIPGEYVPHSDRYRVINLRRSNTVEFRFFKSTKVLSTFLKNMQFAIASSMFAIGENFICDDCKESDPKVLRAFCDFVESRKECFTDLYKFLKLRGLFPRKIEEMTYEVNKFPDSVTEKQMIDFLRNVQRVCQTYPLVPTQTLMGCSRTMLNKQVSLHALGFISQIVTKATMRKASIIKFNI